jgi:hypothetical protein
MGLGHRSMSMIMDGDGDVECYGGVEEITVRFGAMVWMRSWECRPMSLAEVHRSFGTYGDNQGFRL